MCPPSPPKDNSAQITRQQEEERQGRITQGQTAIDDAFGGFNDDFYSGYQNDYLGYYTPQLSDQYDDARKRLTLQLARSGNLTASTGANQMADLKKFYETQNTGITNRALDAKSTLQSNIDARKSQLYADNRAAADPGNAASAAAAAATSLQPTPPSSPLANTFADFFTNLGNATAVYNNSRPYESQTGVQTFNGGNTNSVRTIGT